FIPRAKPMPSRIPAARILLLGITIMNFSIKHSSFGDSFKNKKFIGQYYVLENKPSYLGNWG
ncbi:MAG: hypothetical protein ACRENZ_11790, partial [Thermodesulfobacteriota bacterium]